MRSMPTSSSSSAQAARQHLADQLRELREDAGLSGRDLATRVGWQPSKVSRIEKAVRPASAADIRAWCVACGAAEQRTAELLAEQRAVAGMWVTHKQLHRAGLKKAQESVRDAYERVRVSRTYQTKVIPGLLQTAGYTTEALAGFRLEHGIQVDDVAEAVAERMDRQRVLRRPGKRFLYVVEETVLRYRPFPREVHAEQLRHLLEAMHLPSVSFGVIPMGAERHGMRPKESFDIHDDELVTVELVSGYLSITQPAEVELYLAAWERLWALAVVGDRAAALITAALDALDG